MYHCLKELYRYTVFVTNYKLVVTRTTIEKRITWIWWLLPNCNCYSDINFECWFSIISTKVKVLVKLILISCYHTNNQILTFHTQFEFWDLNHKIFLTLHPTSSLPTIINNPSFILRLLKEKCIPRNLQQKHIL